MDEIEAIELAVKLKDIGGLYRWTYSVFNVSYDP